MHNSSPGLICHVCILALALPFLCAAAIDRSCLQAAWLFREGQGTTVRDWVGHQSGRLHGAVEWVDGRRDRALVFGGGFVTVPEVAFTDAEPWTIAAWLLDETHEGVFAYWLGKGTGGEAIASRHAEQDRIAFRDRDLKFHLLGDSTPYKGAWHHYAFVADGAGALTLYVDGTQIRTVTGIPTQLRTGRIGTSHAKYSFRGKIDSVLVFGAALSAQQVSEAMATPAAQLVTGGRILVTPLFRRRAFARDEQQVELEISAENVSEQPWRGRVAVDVDGVVLGENDPRLDPGGTCRFEVALAPQQFTVGTYELRAVQHETGAADPVVSVLTQLDIAPWRNARQFPLITWPRLYEVRWIESMREAGISVMPFDSVETLDAITRLGGYGSTHLRTAPVHPPAKGDGHQESPCPVSSAYLTACESKAEELLKSIDNHPTLRLVNINTETWGELCFCPRCSDLIRTRFGLDPQELERAVDAGGPRRHKAHFLIPKLERYAPDQNVVSEKNPLLRLAHWWWTEGGLNVGNQRVAATLHRLNPNVWTMTEPLTRFAPLRRYRPPMVVSCWSYPAEPRDWTVTAGFLQGLARNMDCPLVLTVGTLQLRGRLAPYTTTVPVDVLRLESWICLAHLPEALQYFTWEITQPPEKQPIRKKTNVTHQQECEKAVAGLSWTEACEKGKTLPQAWLPGIPEEIKSFSDHVVLPLGPLLRQARPRQARIGLLHSFSSALMPFRGWYYTFDWFPLARNILRCSYAIDVVFEEELGSKRSISRYDALILPSCYVLTEQLQARLQTFIRHGGTVLCGAERGATLPGSVVLEALDYRPAVKLHPTVPERVWDAPDARFGARAPDLRDAVQQALSAVLAPEYQCTTPDVLIREGRLAHTRLLFVVNTRLGAGPRFGHYPDSLEKGEPSETRVAVCGSAAETHLYDLLEARPVSLTGTAGALEFDASLPACGGRIYALYPQPIGPLTLHVPAERRAGDVVKTVVRLHSARGKAFKGCVPLRLEILRPDGQVSDSSHYDVIEGGVWRFTWTVPAGTASSADAVYGDWAVRVHELASGQTAEAAIRVNR